MDKAVTQSAIQVKTNDVIEDMICPELKNWYAKDPGISM